jgi:hypothetical protein
MSVLIEALTLVIRRFDLDIRYPGGTEAFLQHALELTEPPRFICGEDAHLVNLSFSSPEHMMECLKLLTYHGFLDVDDGQVVDMAYVDQHHGPTMPCHWLEWRRHPEGFTYAWLAGTEPGDMAVDEGWTPERSRGMERFDVRDEPGRMLRLAEDDGVEIWLDLFTGSQGAGLPHREDPQDGSLLGEETPATEAGPEGMALGRLLGSLVDAMETLGWQFHLDGDAGGVVLPMTADEAEYLIALTPIEAAGLFLVRTTIPDRVPVEHRGAVCEFLNRANWRIAMGNFEMDMEDGEVVFRVTMESRKTDPTASAVRRLVLGSVSVFGRHLPALRGVAAGEASPRDAMDGLEPPRRA